MATIRALEEACRLLGSDKATERRKQVSDVQRYLDKSEYIEILDRNFESGKSFSWNEMFDQVSFGFFKEDEHSNNAKFGAAQISPFLTLVKQTVAQANSRGKVRLRTNKLVNHLRKVMDREGTWSRFSSDYTKLLLKEVLENRSVLREVPVEAFNDFIGFYVGIYQNGRNGLDQILLFQVIRELTKFCCKCTTIKSTLLFEFFEEVISSCRKQMTSSQQESLISCCLTFSQCVAAECRMQLCHLGEAIFPTLLAMLRDRSLQRLKVLLIKFLKLQMACHHPKGVVTAEQGMLAIDGKLWRRHSMQLCEYFLEEMRPQQSNIRRGNLKAILLEQDELGLCVDIFNQFCSKDFTDNVDEDEDDVSQAAKRPRRDLINSAVIIDAIYSMMNQSDGVIIWLQVLSSFLEKYPKSVCPSTDLFNNFTHALYQLQLNCKSYEIMAFIMSCFCGLLRAIKITGILVKYNDVWLKVYEITLRTVSLKHCINEGYALISQLIECQIIRRSKDLMNLYHNEVSTVNHASLLTLESIFIHGLLENEETAAINQRLRLLDFLMPAPTVEIEPSQSSTIRSTAMNNVSPVLAGELAFRLILVDQSDFESVKDRKCDRCLLTKPESSLETDYLKYSFILDYVAIPKKTVCNSTSADVRSKIIVYQKLLDKVLEFLLRDCAHFLDVSVKPQMNQLGPVVSCCVTTITCLGLLIKCKLWSFRHLARSRHCDVLQKLLKNVTSLLKIVAGEKSAHSLKALSHSMNFLEQLYYWEGPQDFCQTMMQFCREITSEALVSQLQELLFTMNYALVTRSRSIDKETSSSTIFDTSDRSKSDVSSSATDLCDDDKWKMSIVQVLGHLCSYARSPLTSPLRPAEASKSIVGSNKVIVSALLDRLLSDDYGLKNIEKAKLAIALMSELLRPFQQLNEVQGEKLLSVLKGLCSQHYKDPELNSSCLELLAKFIEHLKIGCHPDTKSTILNIINHFWDLFLKGKCGSLVEIAIGKVLVALFQCEAYNWDYKGNLFEETTSVNPCCLVKLLASSYNSVCSFVAGHVHILFNGDPTLTATAKRHMQVLELIYKTIGRTTEKLGNENLNSLDVTRNWTSSFVLALVNVAVSSTHCLKPGVLAICDVLKTIPTSLSVVRLAVKHLSDTLGYPTSNDFVRCHLPYIIYKLLRNGNQEVIDKIWLLTSARTLDEFYEDNFKILVPLLYICESKHLKESITNRLRRPWNSLVEECFSSIMAGFVLPGLAIENYSGSIREEATPKINEDDSATCLGELQRTISKEKVDRLIVSRGNELVVQVFKCLYIGNTNNADKRAIPKPNPPYYGPETVGVILKFLTMTYYEDESSLVKVLCQSKDALQEILLCLQENIEQSFVPAEIFGATFSYYSAVKMILEEFGTSLNQSWSHFLQDVIHTIVNYIRKFRKCRDLLDVTQKWCELLKNVVIEAANVCPQELCKYVILIVNCLVEVVEDGLCEGVVNQALATLTLMVIESGQVLKNSLLLLEPFPNRHEFVVLTRRLNELNPSADNERPLDKAISDFLKILESNQGTFRCEGLQQLKANLHVNRDKISQLVDQLKDLRFSSECTTTLIYRLVMNLVHLCFETSTSENLAVEAAMCLGEIGPVALSAFVLNKETCLTSNPWKSTEKAFEEHPVLQRHSFIFHKLHSYLLDSSVDTKRLASDTLKLLLATGTGQKFLKMYKKSGVGHLDEYLYPFTCSKTTNRLKSEVASGSEIILDSPHLWCPENPCTYDEWICKLVVNLLEFSSSCCELFMHSIPICKLKVDFCEPFLPFIIHAILTSDGPNWQWRSIISRHMNNFLEKAFQGGSSMTRSTTPSSSANSIDPDNAEIKECIFANKKAVAVILEVVKFLRLQRRPPALCANLDGWTIYDNNFWLDLDYLLLSEAAHYHNANLTALMYAEIWWNSNRHLFAAPWNQPRHTWESSTDDESNFKRFQDLLLKIYRCMGESDAMAGCGTSHLSSLRSRLAHYEQEGRWDRALSTYNLMLRNDSNMDRVPTNVSKLTFNMGLDRVGEILRKEDGNDQLPEDYKYECAWRMAQWSLPVMSCNEGDVSIEKAIYSSFVAFRDVHCARFSSAIKRGYLSVIHGFGTDSFETTGSLYRLLSQLAALTHLEECFQLRNRKEVEKLPDVVRSWSHLESLHECNYSVREPILNVETTALKLWSSAEVQCPILRRETIGRLESQVKLARENGVLQWTETFLSDLRKMSSSAEQRLWCSLEETKILWDYNEKEVAKGLLQSLIMDVNKNDDLKKSSLTANCYFYFGLWSMELRSENALVILTDYLEKAINIWKSCVKDSVIEGHLREAYLAAARFADGHYQRVSKYKKSDVYETKQQVIRSSQVAVNNITSKDIDSRKAQFQLKKQIDMDRKEVVMFETTHRRFLLKSLEYYLECLRLGHEHDSRVFRVVALWNENSTLENVNAVIEDAIEKVPSYKFLPLIKQLSARMKPTDNRAKSSRFHEVLDKIIYKVCLNHPYHTLLILLALGNASKDDKSIGRRSSAGGDEEDRVLAAQQMIERLKKTKRLSNVVTSMEKVCDALIRLSYWERKANHGSINDIDKTQPITKLNNVLNVPPFTASIPVDPTGKYDNILHIVKFGPKFKQCDGLSKPKQIWCLGSDGVERLEMIKGRDDLRQDAVMQQVFEMVNTMLKKHKETSRKGLLIRTYKVVPLSRRSGILEWCAPTKSMGQYLANDSFRKRYDPTVWPNLQCRERIKEASGRSPDERCRVYSEICESVKPVFRYFFFEEFPQPSVWYEKRNAYIKSVATSSVVGYILGLGDRHLSNILIDLSTAEVIHIDLGVSFEQGKTLSIPETVPFRLTRDIIDGMGAHGYEGTFRRCCERTLTVMRDSQEVVLTILEVLLYDPLYHWTLTPLQMRKLQDTVDFVTLEDADASTSDARADEEQVNKLAERVLHRMREKLIGQEEANTLSVAGQVSHVIREATDIRNLCMIFCGWQAFL